MKKETYANGLFIFQKSASKNQKGDRRTLERWKKNKQNCGRNTSDDVGKLVVYGTFDILARKRFITKKIIVPHPTDMGYFKEAYILTDSGRSRLRMMKIHKKNNFPSQEWMYEKWKQIKPE
jgi:RIO-like serine/threonine protein kinase